MTLTDHYDAHVRRLESMAPTDDDAARSLACLTLLMQGWRPGDPDPRDDPDPPDGEVVDIYLYRLAA